MKVPATLCVPRTKHCSLATHRTALTPLRLLGMYIQKKDFKKRMRRKTKRRRRRKREKVIKKATHVSFSFSFCSIEEHMCSELKVISYLSLLLLSSLVPLLQLSFSRCKLTARSYQRGTRAIRRSTTTTKPTFPTNSVVQQKAAWSPPSWNSYFSLCLPKRKGLLHIWITV